MRIFRLLLLICCVAAAQVHAAYTAYLLIPGIPGEVTDKAHPNWIGIGSFSEQQVASLTEPGFQTSAFNIIKPVDKATPLLALAVANQTNITTAHLQLVNATDHTAFYDLVLSNVTITAFSQSGDTASISTTDQFTLNFEHVFWTYTIESGGTISGTVATQWDNQTNGAVYGGNGDTSFGGAIGGGTLEFTNDATTLYGTLTKGPGDFTNVLVLYIDNGTGGFSDTSGFNDASDGLRRAVSGTDGPGTTSLLTFTNAPIPFSPSYAIALGPASDSSGRIFRLANGGGGSMNDIGSANLSPLGTGTSAIYTFSFPITQIGVLPYAGETFRFLGTYISDKGYRSSETVGGNVSGVPGWNPFTTTDVASYTIDAPASSPVALTITYDPQASTVTFSWPVTSLSYSLQQIGDLGSSKWTAVTNSATVVSNENHVVVPVSSFSANFYRLKY